MKPTVLMVPRLPELVAAPLRERYTLLGPLQGPTADGLRAIAAKSEVRALLTVGGMRTDAALMDALPRLGLILCYGTGFEGVDRAAAAARGITLCNAGYANAASVAEFAFGLILASARRIVDGDRFVRAGRWKGNAIERMPTVPGLAGRRLGIYGMGAVGSRIATRAAGFEMEIGYHNRSPVSGSPHRYHASLLELARWSDILVVAARAGADNRHAVDAEVLAALGPQGHMINISRGIAVDEEALCDALERGVIAGAALDVYENEPQVSERLKAATNVVLTPHIAANAALAQEAQQRVMLANLEAFFSGAALRNIVAPG